ncbi:MAG: PAS domain S-box protein [Planctomycetes bacterium]|nr:PAS domain S-box protein [Planctomycetota bacterium]
MSATPLRVLVVEDDADTRANLRDILELDGCQVETAGTVAETLSYADWDLVDVIVLDYQLPDGNAETLLPRLRQLAPRAGVIVSTGIAALNAAVLAVRQGAADYIVKPIDADALRGSLARIAERQELARAKERSDAAFRTLVEAAPCMIVILRSDHTILYFSPFAEELTGYNADDVLGKEYFSIFISDPAMREVVAAKKNNVLNGVPTRGFECPVSCKDGAIRWMVWNAQLLPNYDGAPAILAVGQDITSLKQAQEQALQTERLAGIGQMMTGLAHESGNALARSQACLEMLAFAVENQPKALNLITRIQAAQDHLKQLYDEVRNYAAPLKLQLEEWNLPFIWRQAWQNLALHRQGKTASLQEQTGGRITCTRTELNGQPAIRISCQDNGPGLNAEQRQRIFEPFFTTKTKGTGLGMAIAKRIIEAHGGRIGVGSAAARGAEIFIVLPVGKP